MIKTLLMSTRVLESDCVLRLVIGVTTVSLLLRNLTNCHDVPLRFCDPRGDEVSASEGAATTATNINAMQTGVMIPI
jgi:hypothetical protein